MRFFSDFHPILFGILLSYVINDQTNAAVVINDNVKNEKNSILKIAVIGAGVSGLASAKNILDQGFNVTIFEQSEDLGGIWRYTDQVGKDKYGVNIHTAMYQGLRTNTPYQTMEFPGHSYPKDTISYPTQPHVFKYLHSYADRFSLKNYIKLNHLVIRVLPIENDKWEIIVKDLPNNSFKTLIYDAVFVCNGHFVTPRYPNIPGTNEFKGKIMHSHDYRTAKKFRGEKVLIVGGGPSGIDMVNQLSNTAIRVTLSQRKHLNSSEFPSNVILQEEVVRFTPTGAEFIDGTHQTFSVVILATGYNFTYPFLSVDTAVTVDDNSVMPLYKQIINIDHPTMVFIGVPFSVCVSRLQDLQARFALKFISGEIKLPSKDDMLEDMYARTQSHYLRTFKKHKAHFLGPEQKEYYLDLAVTADIENIPDVLANIHIDSSLGLLQESSQFRKYKYTIIDEFTFVKEKYEK